MRSLSPKMLRELRDLLNGMGFVRDGSRLYDTGRLVEELNRALAPKRSAKPARERRETKRQTRKQKTADVRAAVVERAGNRCEFCGTSGNSYNPLQVDHFRGGAHRRSNESVEGCWLLCSVDHEAKTLGVPSRLSWLGTFREHCLKHGYDSTAREVERLIDAESMSRSLPGREVR